MRYHDLFEAYHSSIKVGNQTIEVFLNPSRKEISSLIQQNEYDQFVRGFYDMSADQLVVWSDEEYEHHEMSQNVPISDDIRVFVSPAALRFYADDLSDESPKFLKEYLSNSKAIISAIGRNADVRAY